MSFREFLKTCPVGNNSESDFVRDVRIDPNLPDAESMDELRSYPDSFSASEAVVYSAKIVWKHYAHS